MVTGPRYAESGDVMQPFPLGFQSTRRKPLFPACS